MAYLFSHKFKVIKQTSPVISESVCEVVIKGLDLAPVKKYEGKPIKVDFSSYPEAKMFYTVITEQASEGPNFAGHFTYVGWGCGTDCAGFAIVEAITGKIVSYMPVDEDGNSYSYKIDSRLLILNPKENYEEHKGKTMDELIKEDIYGYHSTRKYYELVEESDSNVKLNKLCTENAFDGIYALENTKTVDLINKITYYAKVKQISTSGDVRFYWYDTESKQIKDSGNQYAWFFALPKNVPDDSVATDKWIKFIKDNQNSVFKITGVKETDDCDYYGSEHCIENIDVKTIEVVDANKSMRF